MEEAEVVKTILIDNWNPSNTMGVTPVIDMILDRPKVDLRQADFILLYNTGASPVTHSAMKTFDHTWSVSIDLRTILKTKYDLYRAEIRRIIESKYILPADGYHRLYTVRDLDLSDKQKGLCRRVIDVAITQDLMEI